MKSLLLLLLCCLSATAQSFTFRTIRFDGAPQYTSDQLLAMSGLTPGKTISQAELTAALEKLDGTGLFSSIDYKTTGPVLDVVLVPMAAKQARTLHFNNFVLDTPAGLDAKLRARVPLFTGTIPINGDLEVKVERALEAILKDEGVNATVTSIGTGGGVLDYSIASPRVVVSSVDVEGVDFASDPSLAAIRKFFIGQDYLEPISGQALDKNLTDAYQDLGFVDFAAGPITRGKPVVTAAGISVALTGTATPGPLYRVAKLDLPTPPAGVEQAELAAAVQLKKGAPASRIEALSTEARVGQVFERHGYLDEHTAIEPHKDEATHTVSYAVTTQPGARYVFRAIQSTGLSAAQAAQVTQSSGLPVGAPYDLGAIAKVVNSASAKALCGGKAPLFAPAKVSGTHQADLVLACARSR